MNLFDSENISISIILNDIMLFFLTLGGLFKNCFISTFSLNSIEPHEGLFKGMGLIVKVSFDTGAFSRGA